MQSLRPVRRGAELGSFGERRRAVGDSLVQRGNGMKISDASSSDWESIIAFVRQETGRAQSDLDGYYAAVKAGDRHVDPEVERVFRQALLDHQTTECILETLYKRQFPNPPTV